MEDLIGTKIIYQCVLSLESYNVLMNIQSINYILIITYKMFRRIITINGQFPGPVLHVTKGAVIKVTLKFNGKIHLTTEAILAAKI